MTAYYADESVTLYHGDCREVGAWLEADVLVTDPPYGVAYVSNFAKSGPSKPIAGDEDAGLRDAVLALWGRAKPGLVFGRWDVPRPLGTRRRLIWDKGDEMTGGDLTIPWGVTDEEVYVLNRWPAFKPGGRRREGGTPARHPSVIRVRKIPAQDADRPAHPTPKPVPLMELLLGKCPPGVIADPFAGSGATLLAARNCGRRAIGVELDEAYCELIASRLSQGVLFGGAA